MALHCTAPYFDLGSKNTVNADQQDCYMYSTQQLICGCVSSVAQYSINFFFSQTVRISLLTTGASLSPNSVVMQSHMSGQIIVNVVYLHEQCPIP